MKAFNISLVVLFIFLLSLSSCSNNNYEETSKEESEETQVETSVPTDVLNTMESVLIIDDEIETSTGLSIESTSFIEETTTITTIDTTKASTTQSKISETKPKKPTPDVSKKKDKIVVSESTKVVSNKTTTTTTTETKKSSTTSNSKNTKSSSTSKSESSSKQTTEETTKIPETSEEYSTCDLAEDAFKRGIKAPGNKKIQRFRINTSEGYEYVYGYLNKNKAKELCDLLVEHRNSPETLRDYPLTGGAELLSVNSNQKYTDIRAVEAWYMCNIKMQQGHTRPNGETGKEGVMVSSSSARKEYDLIINSSGHHAAILSGTNITVSSFTGFTWDKMSQSWVPGEYYGITIVYCGK